MSGPESQGGSPGKGTAGASLTLTVVLLLGLASFLIPVTMIVVPEVVVTGTYFTHNQTAESLAFLLTFFVMLPLAAWRGPLLADRIAAGTDGPQVLTALACGLGLSFGLALAFIRISAELPWGGGIGAAALILGVWLVAVLAAVLGSFRDPVRSLLAKAGARKDLVWGLAGAGITLAWLCVVSWTNVHPVVLVPGLIIVAGTIWLVARTSLPALPRGWGRAIDLLVFLLVVLAVPDMVIFPVGPGIDSPDSFITYVVQFHQNLFLGPASQVGDGQVLLVDTVSQYGIGSIYLIAAFFEIAPIGHGTLGFLDGFLSALVIGTGYLVMRMSGVRRPLAIPAMVVAVIILAWGLTYPIGGLLQHGAIRYGLPILVIAAITAGSRWPNLRRPMYLVGLFLVGLSSIWALEAFLYTLATWVGLIAIGLVWQETGNRWRWLLSRVWHTAAALVAVHVVFALLTLIVSGELPDWNLYLTYLRDFVTGDIGDLTYDYMPWSRGLGVGAFYLAAVITMVFTVWRRPSYVQENRTAFIALAGSLSYGVALYSYFVNRSLDHVLPYLLLPMILVVVISLGLALREGSPVPSPVALGALATAMAISFFAISSVAGDAPDRARTSLLGYAMPGDKSVKQGFDRLWNPPPLVAGADEAEAMLKEYMPGEDRSAVLTRSDLGVEALVRAQRANSLGFTDPKENSWVPAPNRPIIEAAVADLQPGDLMLVDDAALKFIDALDKHPTLNPETTAPTLMLEPLQGLALKLINDNFELVPVAKGGNGLEVVRLEPWQLEWTYETSNGTKAPQK